MSYKKIDYNNDDLSAFINLLFAEASKDPKYAQNDSIAIACVILNRLNRPKRFGATLMDIIFAPYQFSGVGSKEWKKSEEKTLSPVEAQIYERLQETAFDSLNGNIKDITNGADHYFNPKLVMPKWAKEMVKVYTSGAHDFYKEPVKA